MVGFGISVGDFIAGINTLIDIVHSLSDTNGAQADYKELGSELQSLKSGLDGIEALSLEATQTTEFSALNAAVENCRACVERFLRRNSRFKSLENTSGKKWNLATLKQCGREVQWGVWKKNEVENFRGRVHCHTGFIGMLLVTVQAKIARAAQKALTETISTQITEAFSIQRNSLDKISHNSQNVVDKQELLTKSMSIYHTNVRDLLDTQARDQERAFASHESIVAKTGVEIQSLKAQFETMMAFQKSIETGSKPFQEQLLQNLRNLTQDQQQLLAKLQDSYDSNKLAREIPAPFPGSKAAILHDARGRTYNLDLDFIDSADAFIAVLKVKYKDIGLGKIEKGQFVLEDTFRKHTISLKSSWTTVVRPGQQISMSMVFWQQQTVRGICPSCGEKNEEPEIEAVDCMCGMTYRRKLEDHDQAVVESSSAEAANLRPLCHLADRAPASGPRSSRGDLVDEELHHYTQVQILAQLLLLSNERQRTADTSDDFSDDEMSAAVIDLDNKSPTMDFKPTGVGKSEESNASAEVNEDTSSAEPLDVPTTDFKPTGIGKSEESKASTEVNEDTSFAEPLDMPTKFPVPQASGGGGPPSRGKLGEGHKYWTCHQCHHINPLAFSERCIQCQHYRCVYCRFL